MLEKYLDKNNLHHAYLLEGSREKLLPEVLEFAEEKGNEVVQFTFDSLKMEDSRIVKSHALERSMSGEKRIFIISANSILHEAQNSLLKLFEEPIENTHFFVIVPDKNSLLKTLVSRFYVIFHRSDLGEYEKDAEKFIKMPLKARLDFIKELLTETEEEKDEEGNEVIVLNSTRSKSLKFLNALELAMSKATFDTKTDAKSFEHIFKVREFLRMPGSSAKTLLESVALLIPVL